MGLSYQVQGSYSNKIYNEGKGTAPKTLIKHMHNVRVMARQHCED
ncbi:MAG: hypothetical protein ACM3MI_01230 [Clostridiales bacterium]